MSARPLPIQVTFLGLVLLSLGACGGTSPPGGLASGDGPGAAADAAGALPRDPSSMAPDAASPGEASVPGAADARAGAPEAQAALDRAPLPLPADAGGGPPPTGACASPAMCAALMVDYEGAMVRAARCTLSNGSEPCSIKVPSTLKCGDCQAWVTDTKELDALRAQFTAGGCEGCPSRGLGADGRCLPVPCIALTSPRCIPNASIPEAPLPASGACGNARGERVCPPGLVTGSPCSNPVDYCIGGSQAACYCEARSPGWRCVAR